MSAKRNIRMAADIAMTILLPILMAYSLVGEAVHEWLGIVMFLLFIVHQTYWGFVLMSLHLGLHWNMVLGMARRVIHIKEGSLWRTWLLRIAAALVAVYGAYAFLVRGFTEYMFLRTQFVFYDFGEPLPLFFKDYLAVMALFVCIGHYLAKGIAGYSKRKQEI